MSIRVIFRSLIKTNGEGANSHDQKGENRRRFRTLPLTENTGHRAVVYMEEYGLSSGLRVADALIAATAAENSLTLCSGDRSHYRALSELVLKAFRPRP